MTSATYFLGGAYSKVRSNLERILFEQQWEELRGHAPTLCSLAEAAFSEIDTSRAA